MKLQMMFGSTILRGHAGGRGALKLFLTNPVDNLLYLTFGEIIGMALRAGLNSSSGHMWPPGLSLPTSVLGRLGAKTATAELKMAS